MFWCVLTGMNVRVKEVIIVVEQSYFSPSAENGGTIMGSYFGLSNHLKVTLQNTKIKCAIGELLIMFMLRIECELKCGAFNKFTSPIECTCYG